MEQATDARQQICIKKIYVNKFIIKTFHYKKKKFGLYIVTHIYEVGIACN